MEAANRQQTYIYKRRFFIENTSRCIKSNLEMTNLVSWISHLHCPKTAKWLTCWRVRNTRQHIFSVLFIYQDTQLTPPQLIKLQKTNNKMIEIPYNLKVKLFDIKDIKSFYYITKIKITERPHHQFYFFSFRDR